VSATQEFSWTKLSLPGQRAGSCCLHKAILNAPKLLQPRWVNSRSNPEGLLPI
jgi:hypothetical protein